MRELTKMMGVLILIALGCVGLGAAIGVSWVKSEVTPVVLVTNGFWVIYIFRPGRSGLIPPSISRLRQNCRAQSLAELGLCWKALTQVSILSVMSSRIW